MIALRRPAFLVGLRSSMIRSNGAVGAVCAEFVVIINVVVIVVIVVIMCSL